MEGTFGYHNYTPCQEKNQHRYLSIPDDNFVSSTSNCSKKVLQDSKVDPSFKSKRYRDKLRTEIKALETLLPVDRTTLHRKLDSQTVFRLIIAHFRTKSFFAAAGLGEFPDEAEKKNAGVKQTQKSEAQAPKCEYAVPGASSLVQGQHLLQLLDGFLILVTADGTILYASRNMVQHLGFNQMDLMYRCLYGIVHPDDQHELKMILEHSLDDCQIRLNSPKEPCCIHSDGQPSNCRKVSFLCRIKCFSGTTTGYLKMHCAGHMRNFDNVVKSQRTSNQVLFAFCRPFLSVSTDQSIGSHSNGWWSKHELDLKFRQMDKMITNVIGYCFEELEGKSFYHFVHPEDLMVFTKCHKALITTEEIQTMYFRMQLKNDEWMWMHTRGKVVFKNSKKYSVVFTHCPVREEDSTYIQQEVIHRKHFSIRDLMCSSSNGTSLIRNNFVPPFSQETSHQDCRNPISEVYGYQGRPECSLESLHSPHGTCPSTWHANSDRHSPVFPSNHLAYRYQQKEKIWQNMQTIQDSQLEEKGQQKHPKSHSVTAVDRNKVMTRPPIYTGDSKTLFFNNKNKFLSSFSDTQQSLPSRQYLMQINGVGVTPHSPFISPQISPTTLVFQGQLTAYETSSTPLYQCDSWQQNHNFLSHQQDQHPVSKCKSSYSQHVNEYNSLRHNPYPLQLNFPNNFSQESHQLSTNETGRVSHDMYAACTNIYNACCFQNQSNLDVRKKKVIRTKEQLVSQNVEVGSPCIQSAIGDNSLQLNAYCHIPQQNCEVPSTSDPRLPTFGNLLDFLNQK